MNVPFRLLPAVAALVLFAGVITGRAVVGQAQENGKVCNTTMTVDCPHQDICQTTGHCGLGFYHKCVTDATFPTCTSSPNQTCTIHDTGCRWRRWTPMCTAPQSDVHTSVCYNECNS
jgi:hypothetical protein